MVQRRAKTIQEKPVVVRRAVRGPFRSKIRLYPINNRTEQGLTNPIAKGKAPATLFANPTLLEDVNKANIPLRTNSYPPKCKAMANVMYRMARGRG